MDVVAQMRDIISDTRSYVQDTAADETIKNISVFTQNLLYVLDHEKTPAYKLAIIGEYLENIATILQKSNINALRDALQAIKSQPEQQQICTAIQKLLEEHVDLQELQPQLIVFWLQCPCDARALKRMGAFMLFLSDQQKSKIINKDKSLLDDPYVHKIKSVFTTKD